ncbi:MAG: formyltransferase family protein, partial [Myxococcota bacterium]
GDRHVDHVLLAGYMRVLSRTFLRGWRGQILNIHPSLLPEFPGLHAQKRQWEAKVSVAGATVHYVDDGVDTGPTLLQGSIDVRGDEGADGLSERILNEVEHVLYPRAVRLFLERTQRSVAEE